MRFNQEAYDLGMTCTFFSMIGSIFIFVTYFLVKETRKNFFFTMGVYLAISDIALAISSFNIYDPYQISPQTCEVLGFLREFALLSSFMWTVLISFAVFRSIKYSLSDADLFSERNWYICMGYGPALMMSVIPYISSSYGPNWVFCWIHTDREFYSIVSLILLYGPFITCFAISLINFMAAYRLLKEHMVEEVSYEFYRLLLYPMISFTCNIGGFIFMMEAFSYNESKEEHPFLTFLRYYHLITRQLQGLFTALAYGLNFHVRVVIKHKMKNVNCCGYNYSDDIDLMEYEKRMESFSLQKRNESLQEFVNNREALISKCFNDL